MFESTNDVRFFKEFEKALFFSEFILLYDIVEYMISPFTIHKSRKKG